ncbi:MAG TPA: PilZ domain-containing protein [Acidimicrobiales bacterium]|nr:PilZ domain-containing protein [Acidimicrobiales bacterium]
MSDLQAEVFPDRVELEVVESEPPLRTMAAMASLSDRGLTLLVDDLGAVEAFPPGTQVHGSYGDHSGFCQFDSLVISMEPSTDEGRPAVMRLEAPARITTTQRRRFVRADVDITIPVALLNGKAMTFISAPGDVHNLGGGGLMMVIAAHPALQVGSKLALAITVPGGDPVVVLARAVQVLIDGDGPATVRVAFTSLEAADKDRIERFAYRALGGSAPAKLWASGKITTTR